jgi:pimeloyl-ACP methyl ester carboxylesterase
MTLRGYEPDSQPINGDYSLETLAADVIAFVDQLGADKVHLVGHDWGAGITYTAGALYPERFHSLTTLAAPHSGRLLIEIVRHPRQLMLSWYMMFFQLRGLADYFLARNDYAFIRMLWRRWSPGWEIPQQDLEHVINTFRQPGVPRAALAYYRMALAPSALPLSGKAREAAKFQVPVPTLAITGERDRCIDTDVFQSMMHLEDFPAGLEIQQIAGAGHFPHQEQPEKVNAMLIDWLQKITEAKSKTR